MTTATNSYRVTRHETCTDIVPDPRVALCGAELNSIVRELRIRLSREVSAGSEGDDFVIRVHDRISDVAARGLETLGLFPGIAAPGEYDPLERPEVLFVSGGLAAIDPEHTLPIANLLTTARGLSKELMFGSWVGLEGEYLGFMASLRGRVYRDSSFTGRLMDLLVPRYDFIADPVLGAVEPGVIRLMFDCPRGVVSSLAALIGLAGVAERPAPYIEIPRDGLPGPARIHFSTHHDPSDVTGLWEVAVRAILALGVFPTGQFILMHDERTRTVYNPPALSVR